MIQLWKMNLILDLYVFNPLIQLKTCTKSCFLFLSLCKNLTLSVKILVSFLQDETEYPTTESSAPFLFLTMDIPASPLFKDQLEQNAIPQVPMLSLLQKFNGTQEKEYKTYHDTTLKRFSLVKLPNYLILFVKRFNNNTFFVEKNPTIVNFPVKGLDMADFLTPEAREEHTDTVYNLVANITHEGEAGQGKGTYSLHVLHKGSKQWFDLQDLHVKEILPPMITLSESYIQIWELQKNLRPPGLGENNMETGGE